APYTEQIRTAVHSNIIGQHDMIDRLLIGLYCNGHILLEGVPGLAKTLTVRTLAQSLALGFSRIQFTPDLLPADVVGTMIYNQQRGDFQVRKGPIFSNLLLADEINRAPAKVQSALLEAMQEHQVTIGDTSYRLPEPFLVLATQNPLEQEGTYPLPEAQQDRFMLKVLVDYPSREEELQIVRMSMLEQNGTVIQPVAGAETLQTARRLCRQIYVDPRIENFVLDLVLATRKPDRFNMPSLVPLIAYGASPRASIYLLHAARGMALLQKRAYVIPDDVLSLTEEVLRHRIGLTYEAEAEDMNVEYVIGQIKKHVPAP
ncbi:MAG TPA: AAA family ATPase, partial [Phnomibacter sp.]|nr:AAA family ATPase [Phnomibacter sp.]